MNTLKITRAAMATDEDWETICEAAGCEPDMDWVELRIHESESDYGVYGEPVEIEFFPGDEGDIDADDWIYENEEWLDDSYKTYSYEWDNYRKGYALTGVPKEE